MPFNFLPIEPPRTGNPNEETYARRQHQFSKTIESRKKSIFSRANNPFQTLEPPRVSVDARLPNPSILTCNEPVPLRLMAKKLSDTTDIIFLQMLQIELISYTKILAHDLTRQESTSWVIMSRSNMAMPLGNAEDPVGTEWALDPKLWAALPLPNSVAPSFETCNIERAYELEVRVGITHGTVYNMKVCFGSHPHLQCTDFRSPNSSSFPCECQSRSTLVSLPLRPSWTPSPQQHHSLPPPNQQDQTSQIQIADPPCHPDHLEVLSPLLPDPRMMMPLPVTRMQWQKT